jgi:hypothetical protein
MLFISYCQEMVFLEWHGCCSSVWGDSQLPENGCCKPAVPGAFHDATTGGQDEDDHGDH